MGTGLLSEVTEPSRKEAAAADARGWDYTAVLWAVHSEERAPRSVTYISIQPSLETVHYSQSTR